MGALIPTHISTLDIEAVRRELLLLDEVFPPRFGWRKRAAAACGIDEAYFSKKLSLRSNTPRTFFNFDELGRIAACISEILVAEKNNEKIAAGWRGNPLPRCWPFMTHAAWGKIIAAFKQGKTPR